MERKPNIDFPDYLKPSEPIHGTTTVALKFKDGVILAADKRASAGYMVATPRAKKLHKISKRTAMSIAGMVSDAQYLIKLLRAEINLFELNRGREMPTKMIGNLMATIMYGQYRSFFPFFVGPILAGVDEEGGHIFSFDPSGSITSDPFVSTGSGSPFALGVLEAMYEPDMELENAKKVAALALSSAIKKDIATGDGMDMFVITKDGITEVPTDELKKILGNKYPLKD